MEQTTHSALDKLERSARGFFYGSPAFFPIRSCYQSIFDRPKQARRRAMMDFYMPFVRKGDLVFDVGANVGVYSELFSEMGARVIAVEPNSRCCESLRQLARAGRVHVEECAVGDVPGKAKLRVCESSTLSTLTDNWYEKCQQMPLHQNAKWLGEVEIDVVTLDQLAARYGVPRFVKIDVEGYDDHALRGMSFAPHAFSFEFLPPSPEVGMRCLDTSSRIGNYEYNYVREMDMQLSWTSWISADELRSRLTSNIGDEHFGDILARRIA